MTARFRGSTRASTSRAGRPRSKTSAARTELSWKANASGRDPSGSPPTTRSRSAPFLARESRGYRTSRRAGKGDNGPMRVFWVLGGIGALVFLVDRVLLWLEWPGLSHHRTIHPGSTNTRHSGRAFLTRQDPAPESSTLTSQLPPQSASRPPPGPFLPAVPRAARPRPRREGRLSRDGGDLTSGGTGP